MALEAVPSQQVLIMPGSLFFVYSCYFPICPLLSSPHCIQAMAVLGLVLVTVRVWCGAGQVKPGWSLVPKLLIQH